MCFSISDNVICFNLITKSLVFGNSTLSSIFSTKTLTFATSDEVTLIGVLSSSHIDKYTSTEITHIVTDGGSAFCKAFKVYGRSPDQLVESIVALNIIEEDDDKCLHDYPLIRELFIEFNTTLASSGAVERLFSQRSLIFTPRRNRISDDHFEYALLLKYNYKILDNNCF